LAENGLIWPLLLVALASGLDRLLGDPKRFYHPVMAMGAAISLLRIWAEAWAGENAWRLRSAGFAITALVVGYCVFGQKPGPVKTPGGCAQRALRSPLWWWGAALPLVGGSSA